MATPLIHVNERSCRNIMVASVSTTGVGSSVLTPVVWIRYPSSPTLDSISLRYDVSGTAWAGMMIYFQPWDHRHGFLSRRMYYDEGTSRCRVLHAQAISR